MSKTGGKIYEKRTIAVLMALICTLSFVSCSKNVDHLQKIEGQELIDESNSPDGNYIIKVYKNSDGTTVDWAVLCTLTDVNAKKTKNIYWQYHMYCADIV